MSHPHKVIILYFSTTTCRSCSLGVFVFPGPLLGLQLRHWPQICIYWPWPPICIYQPWHQICIYRPWPPICIYRPWHQICIYRPWPPMCVNRPWTKIIHLPPWSLKCIYHPRPRLLPPVCIYQSRSRFYYYHSY